MNVDGLTLYKIESIYLIMHKYPHTYNNSHPYKLIATPTVKLMRPTGWAYFFVSR